MYKHDVLWAKVSRKLFPLGGLFSVELSIKRRENYMICACTVINRYARKNMVFPLNIIDLLIENVRLKPKHFYHPFYHGQILKNKAREGQHYYFAQEVVI